MATPTGVEEYLAGLPDDQRAAMQKLRMTIKAAAPQASETISYRMPAFKYQGRFLVWYAAFQDHYSLYPASEAVREDLGEKLKPYLSGKGTIRFAWDGRLPVSLVKEIVKVRARENAAHRRR
jgi:uncharacterized protein YdhG (YjbR/CyaY superfamily)